MTRRHIVLLLLHLILVAGALAFHLPDTTPIIRSSVQAPATEPLEGARAFPDDLAIISADLFARAAAATPPVTVPEPLEPGFRLIGIVRLGDRVTAIVGGETSITRLGPGELTEGWRVETIGTKHAIFSRNGRVARLDLAGAAAD